MRISVQQGSTSQCCKTTVAVYKLWGLGLYSHFMLSFTAVNKIVIYEAHKIDRIELFLLVVSCSINALVQKVAKKGI